MARLVTARRLPAGRRGNQPVAAAPAAPRPTAPARRTRAQPRRPSRLARPRSGRSRARSRVGNRERSAGSARPRAVTSDRYTTPASASPSCTLATTAFTFSSCDTTLASTSAVVLRRKARRAAPGSRASPGCTCPTGTASARHHQLDAALAPVLQLRMRAGLVAARSRPARLCANTTRLPSTRSFSPHRSIHRWSAEANTSAAAPCSSWSGELLRPGEVEAHRVPGCARSKMLPISWNASVSEAAAKTVSSRLGAPSGLGRTAPAGCKSQRQSSDRRRASCVVSLLSDHDFGGLDHREYPSPTLSPIRSTEPRVMIEISS